MRISPMFLTVLLFSAACNRSAPPSQLKTGASSSGVTVVKVAKPNQMALVRTIELPGTVIAEAEAPLYAKLAGYVKDYYFDIGQRVNGPKFVTKSQKDRPTEIEIEPGTALAEISIPELEDEAKQKRALQRQAETELEQSRQLFAIAKENVNAMKALANEAHAGLQRAEANRKRWQSESARLTKLVKERVVDSQIGEETENQLQSASAAQAEAKARVATAEAVARKSAVEQDKAEADIQVAEARLQVAQAEVQRLVDLLKYTTIRAPFDGVIAKRRIDKGHFVQPAETSRAAPLFTIMRVDRVRVVVEVPEADAALLHDGDEVRLADPKNKGAEIIAKVSRTGGALDPASRTLRVEIDLDNADKKFWPGNFVPTRLLPRLPVQWVLPSTAVAKVGEQMVCYRIESNKAVKTPVKIGRSDGTHVQVLKKLKPGAVDAWEDWTGSETVVSTNAAYITDGQTVQIGKEGEPAKK